MARDFSPEEKLLHLIKGKRKSPFGPEEMVSPAAEEEKAIPKKDKKVTPAEVKKETQREEKPQYEEKPTEQIKARQPKGPKVAFDTKYLYIISGVVLLSLSAFFVFSILSDREKQDLEGLERMIAAISEKAGAEATPAKGTETSQKEKPPSETASAGSKASFEEYQKLLLQKSIFATPVKSRKDASIPAGPTLRELVKDLKLVGIVPGDEPQAIIEDKKSGQTLFLKKGDQIEGIEIKQISNGRVVLVYQEETITLSL